MCLAQGPQPGEARTHCLSVSSQALLPLSSRILIITPIIYEMYQRYFTLLDVLFKTTIYLRETNVITCEKSHQCHFTGEKYALAYNFLN